MGFVIKILHLCAGYPYTNLYRELVISLDRINIEQLIYVPLRKDKEYNESVNDELRNANFIYSKVFNNVDRLFYTQKINKIFCDIKNKVDFKNIDLVHAHFLFSMGGIALKLKKEKNIDYIVTIRNTDVNLFFKYMFHIRKMGINVMKEAKKIVFISPAYKKFVIDRYIPYQLRDYINQKSVIVPNGVNPFWLQNKHEKSEYKNNKKVSLIYVGEFTKNKNIDVSIKAVRKLKELGYNVNFIIVGGRGDYEYKIKKLAKINQDIIEIYDHIEEKEKLLNMYRKSDIFVMPSHYETFGLVYVEAMSQGLPIIYTKGQGIDGYFEDGKVGYSVIPKDVSDVIKKIEMVVHNYNRISKNCYKLVEKFSWNKIAKIYHNIYTSVF
jgi:glycosyltransferase involved in cell wall biosynthesis